MASSLLPPTSSFAVHYPITRRKLFRPPASKQESPMAASERKILFNRIAPIYDHVNDITTLGLHRVWKRMAISWSGAKEGDCVLDLCCGSGDLAFLLSEKVGINGKVTALDFSREQLLNAYTKQQASWKNCFKNIEWVEGDVTDLPYEDASFDAITMGYGLRNVVDRRRSLQEIYRVLKKGSKASILDLNKSTNPFTDYVQGWLLDNMIVPLGSMYGLKEEYAYIKSSIAGFLTGKEQEDLAKEVGFSKAKHYEFSGGFMGTLVVTR